MKDRRDNASGSENYHFIKETIKEKPSNTKSILKKAFCLAAGGAVLGCCAAFAFAAFLPAAVEWFGFPQEKRVDVDLSGTAEHSQSVPSVQNEESTPGTVSYETGSTSESGTDVLEEYEEIYSRVLEIAEGYLAQEEGIVFLESDTDFYILTGYTDLKDADKIQVTFSNGAYALAEMCKGDARIGLSVVRVPKVRLSENTLEEISVAVLGTSASSYLGKPVIAIGSPMGEYDGVVYGMVTSVSGEISAADCAYSQMITDMQGSPESDGVLLDTSGSVIGIIRRSKEDDINMIKALPIAQIQPLLETLCNGEPIPYLGIHGITISSVQAENLGVSTGIYVDSAETDSPAMIAGIQTGDIITGLDGERVENMTEYSAKLHQMSGGENITVELLRRSASDGTYVEMEFDLIIEER